MWPMTVALCVLVISLSLLLFRKRREQFRTFHTLGVPGPEPHWLHGNLYDINKPALYLVLQKWTKLYGKLYGYYDGPRPVLVISDPDIIKEIFVKKFNCFHGRKEFYIAPRPDGIFNHMFGAIGARWKRLRLIINPTFSSVKLQQMFSLVSEKVDMLMDKLSADVATRQPVDMMTLYQGLSMAVIAEVAFGLNVDSLNNPNEPFLVNAQKLFENLTPSKRPFILKIAALFPELGPYLFHMFQMLMRVMKSPSVAIVDSMGDVIQARLKQQINRTDLLQLMLDAKADDIDVAENMLTMTTDDDKLTANQLSSTNETDVSRNTTNYNAKYSEQTKTAGRFEKKLTIQEIKSQGFLFLIAGYETTSTTLSYCTHLLATNPDKQALLLDEMDQYLPIGTEVTYDILQKMSYLHMVLCETLRLYPLANNVVNRRCYEACNVGGLDIPYGMNVQVDTFSVHHDPDIWGDDVDQFIPERFTKENIADRHPMAWLPFGAGPRNCVGLRFALMVAKLVLARILQRYTFEKSDLTEEKLLLKDVMMVVPKNGVTVQVVPR